MLCSWILQTALEMQLTPRDVPIMVPKSFAWLFPLVQDVLSQMTHSLEFTLRNKTRWQNERMKHSISWENFVKFCNWDYFVVLNVTSSETSRITTPQKMKIKDKLKSLSSNGFFFFFFFYYSYLSNGFWTQILSYCTFPHKICNKKKWRPTVFLQN